MSVEKLIETQILLDKIHLDYIKDMSIEHYSDSIEEISKWRHDIIYFQFIKFSTEELLYGFKEGFMGSLYFDIAKEILVERNFNLDNLIFL